MTGILCGKLALPQSGIGARTRCPRTRVFALCAMPDHCGTNTCYDWAERIRPVICLHERTR